jgi:hypothetical protein
MYISPEKNLGGNVSRKALSEHGSAVPALARVTTGLVAKWLRIVFQRYCQQIMR